jgi:tRNA pseudouridine32 synthase/23S rRNA pseudouridine746 synthase
MALSVLPSPLRVLFDSPRLLVVDKPAGVPFHEDAARPGVLQLLRATSAGVSTRLYACHRLDTITSGVLVFAKSQRDAGVLGAAFRSGEVHKLYVALSARRPTKKMGAVVGDMAPSRRGAWKLLRAELRPARTHFVSSGVAGTNSRALRGFLLRPVTGRTHQLRVAMKALGAPVLGDGLYASKDDAREEERAYLHAAAIRLPPLAPRERGVSLVCPPTSGCEFTSDAFTHWFAERFPADVCGDEDSTATWFADDALLRTPAPGLNEAWQRVIET